MCSKWIDHTEIEGFYPPIAKAETISIRIAEIAHEGYALMLSMSGPDGETTAWICLKEETLQEMIIKAKQAVPT